MRFISFDVQLNANRTVLLKWKTTDEIGNDHFVVERSLDGTSWIGMANIIPDLLHEYVYTDAFPQDGVNYYRIKEVDKDQKCSYTQIKSVRIQKQTKLFIWPNPASTELHVDLPFANATIKIMDAGGKVLVTKIISSNHIVVPVHQLKAGVYILHIEKANETYVEKFLKE